MIFMQSSSITEPHKNWNIFQETHHCPNVRSPDCIYHVPCAHVTSGKILDYMGSAAINLFAKMNFMEVSVMPSIFERSCRNSPLVKIRSNQQDIGWLMYYRFHSAAI